MTRAYYPDTVTCEECGAESLTDLCSDCREQEERWLGLHTCVHCGKVGEEVKDRGSFDYRLRPDRPLCPECQEVKDEVEAVMSYPIAGGM